jgi:hypothetical protein
MNISDQGFFFEAEDKFAELIGSRLDGNATLALVSSAVREFLIITPLLRQAAN